MARKIVQGGTFVPEEFQAERGGYVPRRVYGIEFTRAESMAVWDAVADAAGISRSEVIQTLIHSAMEQCGRKHGIPYSYTYVDDALVYLCEELGIDVRQFPHNTTKLAADDFVAHAKKTFADLPLPRNEMQWSIQRKKWIDLWFGWVADQCELRECEERLHVSCEEIYGRPDFWQIATEIEAARSAKAKLIASMDAKPRGEAVKVAADALARISVRGAVGRASE